MSEGASELPEISLTVSVSQVNTWIECKRKWAWKYVAKIPAPPHASAALGSRVHGHLERWLENGTPIAFVDARGGVDESAEIAAAGIHLLPPPGSGVVERKFDLDLKIGSFTGPRGVLPKVMVTGRKDFERVTPEGPEVWDHKTTGNPRWAKTPEDLLSDVQAGVYGWEALQRWGGREVFLRWVYYTTKGARKAWIVPATLTRERANDLFDQFSLVSKDIATTLVSVDKDGPNGPLALPPTPSACEGFGGCPYRGLCNLSPKQRMSSIMSQGIAVPASNLLASLRARQTAPAPVSEGTATPPPAALAPTPPPVAPAPTEPAYGPINPPEASTAPPAPPSELSADASGHPAPVTAKKRAKRTTAHEVIVAPAPGPSAPVGAKAFTLYVDAYPQGAPAKCIEDLIDTAKRTVCATKEVGDYRYLEYGTGPGAVSEAFFEAFDRACAEEDAPAGWVVHTSTFEASFLLSGLAARASVVVRGIR